MTFNYENEAKSAEWCYVIKPFEYFMGSNISNTRDCVSSGYPNTEKRVENMTHSGVFLTKFEVFGEPMKHSLECLIYLLKRNKNKGVNGEVKSSKCMVIKTGYPNLRHGCDFLCFNLMNY